jgi:hypothetical protein
MRESSIADNVVNVGRAMKKQSLRKAARPPLASMGRPVTPAGFALPGPIDLNAANANFAPGSRLSAL